MLDSIANLFDQSSRRRLQQSASISDILDVKDGFSALLCQVMSGSQGLQSFPTSSFELYLDPYSGNDTGNASYVYESDDVTTSTIDLSDLMTNDTICVQTTFYSVSLFNDSVYQQVQPLPLFATQVWPGLETNATVSYSFLGDEVGNATIMCLAYSAADQAWGNDSCSTSSTVGDNNILTYSCTCTTEDTVVTGLFADRFLQVTVASPFILPYYSQGFVIITVIMGLFTLVIPWRLRVLDKRDLKHAELAELQFNQHQRTLHAQLKDRHYYWFMHVNPDKLDTVEGTLTFGEVCRLSHPIINGLVHF